MRPPDGLTASQRDAFDRGAAAAVTANPNTVKFETLDLAAVGPCPKCGTPTRRMGVPIAGSGTQLVFAYEAHCSACIQAGCVAALAAVATGVDVATGGLL